MSLTLFDNSTALDPSVVIVTLPPGLTLGEFQHRERTMGQLLRHPHSPIRSLDVNFIVAVAITHAVAFSILLWD
jgi:hypothetical protein